MKSLRDTRQEFWRRSRMIYMRHRPLPGRSHSLLFHRDALLGLDLDSVLEGPDRIPVLPVASREEQIVVAAEPTEAERVSIQLQHAAEMRDPNGVRRGRYAKHRSAEQARRLQELVDKFQRESRRR